MTGLEALRRANPRNRAGFAESVETATAAVRTVVAADNAPRRPRWPTVAAAGAVALAVVATMILVGGSPGGGSGTESAIAAVRRAATVTATAAERSGTATVRITHRGAAWAGATIRWREEDLAVTQDAPARPGKAGSQMRAVDGMLYGIDPETGGWVELGSATSIDPDSGTTPGEILAAVREDAGGVTMRRITGGMSGVTTTRLPDGTTVYRGSVPAGLVARETGFKESEAIRVLPFGYVAHDEAEDLNALLDASVTLTASGIVRELAVRWGSWSYAVTYSALGDTSVAAPKNARPFDRGAR